MLCQLSPCGLSYSKAQKKSPVPIPRLCTGRTAAMQPIGVMVSCTGFVFAEDMSCNMLAETIARQEMKNTPGRKNEWMPAFFQVTCKYLYRGSGL